MTLILQQMKPYNPKWYIKVLIITTIVACTIFLCNACVTEKQRARICATCPLKETVKDSIGKAEVKLVPFDTAVWLKNHIGKDMEFVNCDSLYALLERHQNAITTKENGVKSTIVRKGGKITFRCETDSLKAVIELLKKEVSTAHYKTITRDVPARCDKDHRTWWDGLYKRGFWILLVLTLGAAAWKLRRFI